MQIFLARTPKQTKCKKGGSRQTWLTLPGHTKPKVEPQRLYFFDDHLNAKKIQHLLITSGTTKDQRILQCDLMTANSDLLLQIM